MKKLLKPFLILEILLILSENDKVCNSPANERLKQ